MQSLRYNVSSFVYADRLVIAHETVSHSPFTHHETKRSFAVALEVGKWFDFA